MTLKEVQETATEEADNVEGWLGKPSEVFGSCGSVQDIAKLKKSLQRKTQVNGLKQMLTEQKNPP